MVKLEELQEEGVKRTRETGECSGLVKVKEEVVEEVVVATGDLGVLTEVKEELEEGVMGDAMWEIWRRRGGAVGEASGSGGFVPGVDALPGGRVPELLGFSSEEIARILPSRVLGPFVPYMGEVGVVVGGRRGKARGRASRPCQTLAERRHKQKKPSFGVGRHIRLLTNVNRDLKNRPLPLVRRVVDLPVVPCKRQRIVSPFGDGWGYKPQSWHRQKYHESDEGFGNTGRYHPTDARLKREGIFEAIYNDLELYKIPPADWWPPSLSYSDYYSGSSSSDTSESSGTSVLSWSMGG